MSNLPAPLKSKKFWTMVCMVLTAVAEGWGYIDGPTTLKIEGALLAYMGGLAMEDHGKAAKNSFPE